MHKKNYDHRASLFGGFLSTSDTEYHHIMTRLNNLGVSQTLTDAATVAWDTDSGAAGVVTLGGNRTMGAPTNMRRGARYYLTVTQDGTGSRTLAWNAVFDFQGATPVVKPTAAASTYFIFDYDGTKFRKVWSSLDYNNTEQTLTDGANIDWDTSSGAAAVVTLEGNRTMNAPTNLAPGRVYTLKIIQDGTGSRTITWNAVFDWAGGTAPTLTTTGAAYDVISFVYIGSKLTPLTIILNAS